MLLKNRDSIKTLIDRMSSDDFSTSFTNAEFCLAFYGLSVITNYKEDYYANKSGELYCKGDYEEAFDFAQKALNINPLNLEAIIWAERCILKLPKKYGDNRKKNADYYRYRAIQIYNVIATSGDGSPNRPFYVTRESDEYNFMKYFLKFDEFGVATSIEPSMSLRQYGAYELISENALCKERYILQSSQL